jgi:hypothetical protein
MNALRRTSLKVLIALAAVVAVGAFQSSALAGGHHHHKHHHAFYSGHHHGHLHVAYPRYVNYNRRVARPLVVPVTYYDYFGRPYTVWQTNYSYWPY